MTPRSTCFVIMPFGDKRDADRKVIAFDKIYAQLIKSTVEGLGIECVRCDEIAQAGWIHAKMFEHIYESDIAIVDITSLNPNVFYELGVRHALVESITVLLRRKGTKIPFNIQGFQVIEYDTENLKSVKVRRRIEEFIQNGLKSNKKDSPVHEVLSLKIKSQPKLLTKTEVFEYRLNKFPAKRICLITGDIRNVKDIDIWVNSENTNMEMDRHCGSSISSVIRYSGAKKKPGRIEDDVIARQLARAAGNPANVPAGEIVVTGAGELEHDNGVKKIFHAAAVIGEVGRGYTPIRDIGTCVRNALQKADDPRLKNIGLKSILFPLIGTGNAKGDLEQKAPELIGAAIAHLEANPECRIERVYFLTWSEKELKVCQRALQKSQDVAIVQKNLERSR